jgi:excisionase family DNA binding protein
MPRLRYPSQPRQKLPPRAYSIDEACDVLGVCKANLYNLMRRGKLPYVAIAGRRKIPVVVIDDLLKVAPPE